MKAKLRILHLEDNKNDSVLIHSMLCDQGIVCELERVQTREAFTASLEQEEIDLIFSDFSLPGFNGLTALEIARQKRPEVPFLFISGTLGEEVAIDSLKKGATDYVLKQRLSRLVPSVRRAIQETEERAGRLQAEEAMVQSEFKYRQLFECLSEAAFLVDARNGRVLDTNRQGEALLHRSRGEIMGLNQNQFHPPATLDLYRRLFAEPTEAPERAVFEGQILTKEGSLVPVAISASPITLYGHPLILGLYRDKGGGE